jgi:hypothetical protein
MNLDKLIQTVLMIGADLPAYKALFDQVVATFSETDQDAAKTAYADALAQAKAAHEAAQSL